MVLGLFMMPWIRLVSLFFIWCLVCLRDVSSVRIVCFFGLF